MISNIEFNGYRFFDNSILSFVADARTKKLMSNSVEIDGKNILKTLGIYGPNNSGKTNIVKLMSLVKNVLLGKELIIFNNPIFNDPESIYFSIIFNNLDDLGWIKYEFTYNNTKLQYESEKLSSITYYQSGKYTQKVVFEKNNKDKILKVFDEDKSEYLSIIPSRLPFLYSIELESMTFSNLKEYLSSLQKLADSIQIVKMYDIPIENTIEAMKNRNNKKINFIKEFVKSADIDISDFEYNDEALSEVNGQINEEALNRFKKLSDKYRLLTTYGSTKVPSFLFDSTGTKKIESIASYIYDALVDGKTLIIDEMDNGLHFKLTRSIVSLFNNMINTKGQLLFITHDLLLIDCNKLMRKDQIYFINRHNHVASLYCLKEATVIDGGPREVNDIIKHYNRGEFGNVPNPNFIDLIIEVLGNEQ